MLYNIVANSMPNRFQLSYILKEIVAVIDNKGFGVQQCIFNDFMFDSINKENMTQNVILVQKVSPFVSKQCYFFGGTVLL